MDISTIRNVVKGELIRADVINAIINAVKLALQPPVNRKPEFGNQLPTQRRVLNVYAPFEIPAFSVFGIAGGSTASGGTAAGGTSSTAIGHPQVVIAGKIGNTSNPGSPFLPLTNGPIAIAASTNGTAYPIDYFDSCEIVINPAATPKVGNTCGPTLGALTVDAKGCGFICLSASSSGTSGGNTINVMRTREPIAIKCSATGTIASGATGNGIVMYGSDKAVDPNAGSGDWLLVITNPSTNCEIKTSKPFYAIDILGQGLTALPVLPCIEYATATSNIVGGDVGGGTATLDGTGETIELVLPYVATSSMIVAGSHMLVTVDPCTCGYLILNVFQCLESVS